VELLKLIDGHGLTVWCMICMNCTFHYSVWLFHLSFCYKFWDGWHQLICWFNVSLTLRFPDVINVLQRLLLMSLHVVLPHLFLFRCTCSDCCLFCYHLRVGLSLVFECLLHHLWLPLVLVLFYSYSWMTCQCFKLLVPNFIMSGYWCWLHYSNTSVSPAI